VIIALPARLTPVTAYRSTLVISSLATLGERGLTRRYFDALVPEARDGIRGAIAGVWLPADLVIAHYRACDTLGLPLSDQLDIGRAVGAKIRGTLLGTLVGLARDGAGVSPWTFLSRLDRLYDRLVQGGGLCVERPAPKDAVVEVYNVQLFAIPYFATAWRGVIQGMCELFCEKAYVRNGLLTRASTKMRYVVSWV
jgi:hypothetical protein